MMSSNHPLPAPPGQQQRHGAQVRPRTKSTFSFRSHHSNNSTGSGPKIDLHETHQEKEARRLTTKADPSMAITEAEPSAVASGVKSSLQPLRSIQHRDHLGNPIADPDRSNPTRSRWERPLDTIRSFEAAIDGNYSRKSVYMRNNSSDAAAQLNRRGSYFGGTQVTTDERSRYQQNNYYGGGRSQSYRPESYVDGRTNGTRPNSYYYNNYNNNNYNNNNYNNNNYNSNGDNMGPSNGYYPNRARYPRTASEPHLNNQGVYPVAGNQQSYETVTTASGSGSSPDHGDYSTDPSSENSSMDRIQQIPQKEPSENYGFNGFGGNFQVQPPGSTLTDQYDPSGAQRQGNGYQGPPAVPTKEASRPRVPIKLGATSGNAGPAVRPSPGEKRKSWFGRRFSKAS